MFLEEMRPTQVEEAAKRHLPLLLPIGSIETHGYHLPVNTDLLFTTEVAKLVEKRLDCVVAPPVCYSITGHWVAGPELGTVDIEWLGFRLYVKSILENLAKMGFKRIFILNHHQGEGPNIAQIRSSAQEIVVKLGVEKGGVGWWGKDAKALKEGMDLPSINVLHVSGLPGVKTLGNHAGMGETAFVRYVRPDLVDMEELGKHGTHEPWYCFEEGHESEKGTPELGKQYLESMVEAVAKAISLAG